MVMKKDFKAIAEIVKKQTNCVSDDLVLVKMVKDVGRVYAQKLADYFATQNPRFDRQKFLNACGL